MRRLVLALLPLVVAGCGDLLGVEVAAKEVCVRQTEQPLPGIGAGPSAPPSDPVVPASGAIVGPLPSTPVSGSISDAFPIDLGDLAELTERDVDAALDVRSFRISADGGAFAGLDRLSVLIEAPAGSSLPPLTLVDFPAKAGGAPIAIEGDTVSVDLAAVNADLLRYATAGQLTIRLDAQGALPVSEWHAAVEVCAAANARYTYPR